MSEITTIESEVLDASDSARHPANATVAAHALASAAQTATPSLLLQMAIQQGAGIDVLERLMGLQERHEANEVRREAADARKAFVAAMTAFKAMPLVIFKKKAVGYKTNDGEFVGYMHAELSDVTDVVGPAMAKHQLSYRWDIRQNEGRVTVACVVTHVLGHSESVEMFAPPDASGKKNAIQAIASASHYLQRYTLLAVTGMSTKGMDDDGADAGDGEAEARRAKWLEDQLVNIRSAANVKHLKSIMDYALRTAREQNDMDMEERLIAARDTKLATAKPPEGTQS